jgi:hypothetical protein
VKYVAKTPSTPLRWALLSVQAGELNRVQRRATKRNRTVKGKVFERLQLDSTFRSESNSAAGTGPGMTVEDWIDLGCHPSTPATTVRAIQVLVNRSANAELYITFRLDGDIPRIKMSQEGPSRIGTELWRHTCFEAFIAVEGQTEYHEFNFAPSGEWTVYAFRDYRNGRPLADEKMDPQIAVRSSDSRLELDALVRLDTLSDIHPHALLRIGLSAIIEASDGLSYWALRHPEDKPDFHNAESFALLLEAPCPER